ncbi:hypothetical protein AS4_28710 [Acinetobacter guillouiae]|nr:hypothetical protein AS4_28710 [Acinetobacter guillouiae]
MCWEVRNFLNLIHVIPINDLKKHTYTHDCICNCSYEDGVYIHNAFDERELTENLPKS